VRREGLEELGRRYWKPVYHFVRVAWKKSNEEAKDLTQAFFLWLLEEDALRSYDPGRAPFRPYLKSLLRHFLQNSGRALQTLKRGGGVRIVALDAGSAGLPDPAVTDPDRAFDRAYLRDLMERAIHRVRQRLEPRHAVKFRVFEAYDLRPPEGRPTYVELARQMGLKETDVSNYLFSVREEIRAEMRAEFLAQASRPEEAEEEWHDLLGL
jgi:RNA polymerase sigma-70 factor (ECF subfamily)